ncbi:MAG: fumarylacetoacetate hydrolase family protein [Ramlibacter sp.]|nr:fumarylacetoacetate hydrolase family protein [Ramlibacter sp.]
MITQLVTFEGPEGIKLGLMQDGKIYAAPRYTAVQDVLNDWAAARDRLQKVQHDLASRTPVAGARLRAPLSAPKNIYFAGANYKDHIEEMKRKTGAPLDTDPKRLGHGPWHALKATGPTIAGPGDVVTTPSHTKKLDWEIELAVVIGRTCKNASIADAYDYVAGYTIADDLSARDHIGRDGVADNSPFKWDWVGQKSFDGSCPLGPAITPHDFVGDPMNLGMKLWVNGELMQDSNTSQMVYNIQEQIAHLSSRVTLQPGDVILTGTPSGVGAARGRFLQPGDVVRHWIDHIGEFQITIE